ncbi:hypothetical protein [Terrabacter terrigena]|uniref:DUF11 domain-containing protein n=1 Tax=Terrabacter terrigena TaxID=574718 RepID=A0ABW3N3G4_9MICO
MRSSVKLFGALALSGLVAVAGSAFTATSTIDSANKVVGATSQSISGVSVSNVAYTTDPTNDVTSAVTFHVTQDLTAADTVTATITGTTTGATPAAGSSSATCTHDALGAGAGTNLACTFSSPLSNVTKLDIVAS